VGEKLGGSHANPLTSSWFQRPDGTLVDMRAGFELYGGPAAVSVNRIAAGPDGWLIGGNRRSGAAVWLSADATDFRLLDDDPALSSDAGHQTVALDQVHDGSGWTTVGRAAVPDRVGPVPLAWTSPDGTAWTREEVPAGTEDFADLERVVRAGSDLLAVGIRGDRFGVWRRTAGRWRATDSFGRLAAHVTGAPFVSGLVASRERAVVAVTDGADFRLWADTGDGWTPVRTPMRPANTGDDQLSVAADGSSVLLLADDGRAGRVWLTSWAELSR
jgi:hypothetical protein